MDKSHLDLMARAGHVIDGHIILGFNSIGYATPTILQIHIHINLNSGNGNKSKSTNGDTDFRRYLQLFCSTARMQIFQVSIAVFRFLSN